MPNHTTLSSLFGDIADAIRAKTGGESTIVADNFPSEIGNITTVISSGTFTVGNPSSYENTSGSAVTKTFTFSVNRSAAHVVTFVGSTSSTAYYGAPQVVATAQILFSSSGAKLSENAVGCTVSVSYTQSAANITVSVSEANNKYLTGFFMCTEINN